MAGAPVAWDAAAHRRECVIPPDQLLVLNALPGWQRTFQAAPLDETPDESPTGSQQALGGGGGDVRLTQHSPGAHARKQRAPVMSFDDEDDEDDADANTNALLRAGRAVPTMNDPQTKGLRNVATSDPPRATDSELAREREEALAEETGFDAFSPVQTRRGAAAKESVKPTQGWEDIQPTQLGPDENETRSGADIETRAAANRGAASALAALFSPGTALGLARLFGPITGDYLLIHVTKYTHTRDGRD